MKRRLFCCSCTATLGMSLFGQAHADYKPGVEGSGGSTVVEFPKDQPSPRKPASGQGQGGGGSSALALRLKSKRDGCSLQNTADGEMVQSLRFSRTSGNQLLDGMLAQENARLTQMFLAQPDIAWFDDSDGPNAFATSQRLIGASQHGSVLMGISLCGEAMQRFGNRLGEFASWIPMTILAHEFGHITQFMRLNSSRARHEGKYPELHADFLAGCYMGQRALEGRVMFGANLMPPLYAAVQQFFSIGDTNFTSSGHHGTGPERAAAFSAGVQLIDQYVRSSRPLPIDEAFTIARRRVGY